MSFILSFQQKYRLKFEFSERHHGTVVECFAYGVAGLRIEICTEPKISCYMHLRKALYSHLLHSTLNL